MEHISTLLKTKQAQNNWSNRYISTKTHIEESTVSKHLNGKRTVSEVDLNQYCKCFGLNFEDIKKKYVLTEIEICKKGTLKEIIATVAGVAGAAFAGTVAYNGAKKIIEDNCNKKLN